MVGGVGILESPIAEIIALKIVGALAGGTVALITIPSTPWRLRWRRLSVSVAIGAFAEPVLRNWMGWFPNEENILTSAFLTGALSWWAAQAAVRLVRERG